MKRRTFLSYSALATAPLLLPNLSFALQASPKGNAKKIVLVHLKGGNDGYNTIIPYSNPAYYKSRPTLALEKREIIKLDQRYGFHPALKPLHSYFNQGKMLIINNVCLPEMENSHDTAIKLWETETIKQAPPNLACHQDDFVSCMEKLADEMNKSDQQIYRVSLDGFDTHQFQKHKHELLLARYADGMDQLLTKLEKTGKLANTLIVTWSEFGRTWKQNAKKGTDHGNANTLLLFGGSLQHKGILKTQLPNENIDFKQIYYNLVQQWLQAPSRS